MEWCKLYARYPRDPRIQAAGEAAEVLFLRSLAYCAEAESDGFVPDSQLAHFALPHVRRRVDALVTQGLWVEVDGGWLLRRWQERQLTAAQIERKRKADRERLASARVARDAQTSSARVAEVSQRRVRGELEDPPQPPLPGGSRCQVHKRQRHGCADCALPPLAPLPSKCGDCDENRWLTDDDGRPLRKCPVCHIASVRSA